MFLENGRGLLLLAPDGANGGTGGGANTGSTNNSDMGNNGNGQPNNQGTQTAETKPSNWTAQLREDLRNNEAFKGMNKISDLADAYLKLNAGKGVEQNKGDSGSFLDNTIGNQVWDGFDAKLGEETDPYGNISKNFINVCKEKGINPSDAKELFLSIESGAKANAENYRINSNSACIKALKKSWGDNYEANVKSMNLGYEKLFNDNGKFKNTLNKAGLGSNPLICEMLRVVGSMFNPNGVTGSSGVNKDNELSEQEKFIKSFSKQGGEK